MEFLVKIDEMLFVFFNSRLVHPVLDFYFTRATHPEFWIIPALIALPIFIYYQKKKALLVIALALVTVAISDPLSSQILKPLFGRYRPCHPDYLVEGGRFLFGMKGSYAFPSSHSMNMFAQAALLCCFYPKKWFYFVLFASMIAYSRIYVGVHYPMDVVAGALFGSGVGLLVFITYKEINRRIKNKQVIKTEEMKEKLVENQLVP